VDPNPAALQNSRVRVTRANSIISVYALPLHRLLCMTLAAILAYSLALFCGIITPAPALAQDSPPFEEEGFASRPAVRQHTPAKPGTTRPTAAVLPAKAQAKPTPQVKRFSAPPAARPIAKHAPHHGPAVKNDSKRYLRSLDEDHDGRITHKEFLARNEEQFAQLDTNHDGRLSPAELKRTPKTFAKLDTNGDGHLSRKEFLARREDKFAELDRSQDGVLSREEAKAAKLEILHRRAEKKAEKKAATARKAERQAVADEKAAAKLERARKREERAAEKEAKAERRMLKKTEKARAQWRVLLPPPDMSPAGQTETHSSLDQNEFGKAPSNGLVTHAP